MYYESFGHDFRINKCTKDMYVCHDIGFNYQRREIWPLVYTWIPCHLGALRAKRKSMLDFPKKNVVMVGRKHIIFFFFFHIIHILTELKSWFSYGHIFMQESVEIPYDLGGDL